MKKFILKPLIFAILSLLLIVFSFEIILQGFFPKRIVPDLHQAKYNLPAVLRPNLDVILDWSHGYLYPPFRLQTNSKSFLGEKEYQYEKPQNTFRILMLGNSIFMGLGVENNELFSQNLEGILNQKSHTKKIEVINFSGVAWSAIQFFTFLQIEGYKYKPDIVIISQGENDFRVEYNNLIEVNKIKKEILSGGKIKINLEGQKINSKINNPLSILWEWVRKLPFYLEISKHSQALYQFRSKVNDLWYKKTPQIPRIKKLGYFLEANNIELTAESIIALNSDEFSIQPEGHSILFYAKAYNHNLYEAQANIALHSAMQVKIAQFLNGLGSDFIVADIPSWQETLGAIEVIGTRDLRSSLKNYFYLNPTKEFIEFQSGNIETPLYFFNNNHLAPAGHRLAAIIVYNFLAKNNLLSFQDNWALIDPFGSQTRSLVNQANDRIRKDMETDIQFYKYKGLFYQLKGDYKLAKENISQYIEKEKNDFEAYYILGTIFFQMNQFSSALKFFEKSFGGQYIEMERYKYAYNFTKFYKEGWESFKNGELEKALSFTRKLEKIKGYWWAQGVFLNFLIYHKMGDYKNAERYIEYGLKLWPKNLKFILIMASLKFEQRQYDHAIEYAFQALKLNENERKALLILGLSYKELGNKKEAESILSKYLGLDPSNQFAQEALVILRGN